MENKLNIKFAGQIRTERPDSGMPEYNVASHNMLLVQVLFEFNNQAKKVPSLSA